MRPISHQVPSGITITLLVIALTVLFTACSEEYTSPLNSGAESSPPPSEFRYPELTAEMLAAGPAPGFRFLALPATALDDGCDSASAEQFCDRGHDRNVKIDHFVEIKIFKNRMQSEETVRIVAPATCYAVADFYPHPYQFTGTVRIKWKIKDMGFPDDFDFSTLVPYYVTDSGEYLEMPHEWHGNYDELLVWTDHFSRYIVGQRAGG